MKKIFSNLLFGRIFDKLNFSLIEKGISPPWFLTKKKCLRLWRSVTNENKLSGNTPEYCINRPREIIDFVNNFWKSYIKTSDKIMELGCSSGGNLNLLNKLGYKDLAGIDINKYAIIEMEKAFPNLEAEIIQGDIIEELHKMPSNSVDVIFTMAVLMHVHPKDNSVFSEIVRVAKKFIVCFEKENESCTYIFPRNYKRVFEKLGAKELKSVFISDINFPKIFKGYYGYVLKLFTVI